MLYKNSTSDIDFNRCKGYIVTTDSNNFSAPHQCSECKVEITSKEVMQQDNNLKLEEAKVNRYKKNFVV